MTTHSRREQTRTDLRDLLTRGEVGASESLIQETLVKDPFWSDAWIELVKLQAGTGRGTEAMATLRSGLRQNHESGHLWFFLGVLESNNNRHADGLLAFEKALVTDPGSAFTLLRLAVPSLDVKDSKNRENLLSWACVVDPLSAQVRLEIAKCALARRARAAAVEINVKGALVLAPGKAESYYINGVFQHREMNNLAAMAEFKKTLILAPNNPAAFYQLARSAFLTGNNKHALPAAETAIELGYAETDVRFLLARILRSSSRFDDSRRQLDRIEKLDPEYAVRRRMVEWTVTAEDFHR